MTHDPWEEPGEPPSERDVPHNLQRAAVPPQDPPVSQHSGPDLRAVPRGDPDLAKGNKVCR